MAGITIKGDKNIYCFSIVEADFYNMPDWGGIYICVNATTHGINMENCVAIGSCSNFNKYKQRIKALTEGNTVTHVYLLPEFEVTRRQITLEDLMKTPAFEDIMLKTIEFEDKFSPATQERAVSTS